MNAIRTLLITASLLAAATLSQHAHATGNPPEFMSYQGYLVDANGAPLGTDGSGNPLPSNYDVVFRIYNASSGGTLLWAEQQTITIDNGYFSVLLGEGTQVGSDPRPSLSSVFTGIGADERFIGVAVRFEAGGEFSDILPRLRLLASPYAYLASQARSVVNPDGQALITAEGGAVTVAGSLTTTQPLTAPSLSGSGAGLTQLNASNISSGTISAARIPGLDASKITSGFLSSARFPTLSAGLITSGTLSNARLESTVARTDREQAFTARQRFRGSANLDDQVLYIRGGNDTNHGLAYSSSATASGFGSPGIDGPLLWGNLGGGLGISNLSSGNFSIPLRWSFNRVEITSMLQVIGLSFATAGHFTGSSRETKENFEALDAATVLSKVRSLPVSKWSYIDGGGSRHIGPMAEDFYATFGVGINDTSINVSDVSGVALVAIQALDATVQDQQAEIAELRQTVADLQAAVASLLEAQNNGQ
jgi:hypothetical protein